MVNVSWIVLAASAALLATFSSFLDNYTADVVFGGKKAQAEKMLFGPMYVLLGLGILITFQPQFESWVPILLLLGSGMISSLGSIPYFAGMVREEATAARIFCQLVPVFNLVLAWIFLHQAISPLQLLSFGVILAAPVIVVLAKRKRGKTTSALAAMFFILYGLFSAVSTLLFVSGSNQLGGDHTTPAGFLVAMAVMLVGKGCMDMVLMGIKKNWREHFWRRLKLRPGQMIGVVVGNFMVWEAADMLYRLALLQSDSVAMVSVSYEAIELILTFFLGVVLSLLWPKFGRENLDKKTVLAHLIATGVALIGIFLIR